MMLTRIGSGTGPGSKFLTEALVDALRGSLRVSVGPLDHSDITGNTYGFYRANLLSGTTVSIAGNGPIGSFRWSQASVVAVLLKVTASPAVPSAVTTDTIVDMELIKATSFTASDTTGTAITPTKVRSSNMGASLVSDLRVCTTAALTAGTRTLDSVGFAHANWPLIYPSTATGTAVALPVGGGGVAQTVYEWNVSQEHPMVFQNNEGFIAREITAGPTSGGIRLALTYSWAELAYF